MIKNFRQFINESIERDFTFYIDMDGVLADFDGAIDSSESGKAHTEAMNEVHAWMAENYPDVEWRLLHDLKDLSKKIPELGKLYKKANDLVIKEAVKEGFFKDLKILSGAKEILQLAKDLSGKLPHILTACVKSHYCEPEKREWMKTHFDGLYDKIYYEQEKEKFAKNRYDILVDDRRRNIEKFKKAGGTGIYHYTEAPKRTLKLMKHEVSSTL